MLIWRLIPYEGCPKGHHGSDCLYSGVTMKLGPLTWLIPATAAQVHAEWIFLCFRNPPAVSVGMSGSVRGSTARINGRLDGWVALGVRDRGSWSYSRAATSASPTAERGRLGRG
jgi:hypothetical protein